MTPFSSVYDAFFRYVTDDMYMEITEEETRADCRDLLLASIPLFEFPNAVIDITTNEDGEDIFTRNLTLEEQNILGMGMVQIWIQRQMSSIEVTRQKFSGADFKLTSQASHLKQLTTLMTTVKDEYRRMLMIYSRHEVKDGKWKSTFGNMVKRMS